MIFLTLRHFVRIITRQLLYITGTRRGAAERSGGQVAVEVPSAVAQVGTASVPPYGLLLLARFFWLLPWCALCSSFVFTQIAAFANCDIALRFGFMVLFTQPLHIFGLVFAAVHQRLFMVDLIPGAGTLLFSRSRARVRFAKLIFLLRISWQGKRH